MLPRGLSPRDEAALKDEQGEGEEAEDGAHDDAAERRAARYWRPRGAGAHCIGGSYPTRRSAAGDAEQQSFERQVGEEEAVIAAAHAAAEPPAVVV